MAGREENVFMAKLAEQAERYEGKRIVFDTIGRHFVDLQSSSWRVVITSSRFLLDKHFF